VYPAVYMLRDPRQRSRPVFYVGGVPQRLQSGLGRARAVDLASGHVIPDTEWDVRQRVTDIQEAGLTPLCEVIYSASQPLSVALAVEAVMATLPTRPLNRKVDAVLDPDGVMDQIAHPAPVTLPEDCWALVHVLPSKVAPRDVLAPPERMLRAVRDFTVGSEPVGAATRAAVDALMGEGERVLLLAVTSGSRGRFMPGIVAGVWQVASLVDRGRVVRVTTTGDAAEEAVRTQLRWGLLHIAGQPFVPKTAVTRGLWLPHTPR
jgi:hypothetical protein